MRVREFSNRLTISMPVGLLTYFGVFVLFLVLSRFGLDLSRPPDERLEASKIISVVALAALFGLLGTGSEWVFDRKTRILRWKRIGIFGVLKFQAPFDEITDVTFHATSGDGGSKSTHVISLLIAGRTVPLRHISFIRMPRRNRVALRNQIMDFINEQSNG